MKTFHRFLLGALSSLLFAVGLARAADHFDPISQNALVSKGDAAPVPADYCSTYCDPPPAAGS